MNDDIVNLAVAPSLPGLVFRRMRGEADLRGILAVINGSKAADGIDEVETLDNLRNNYEHPVNSDLANDLLLVEVNGQVVGYSRVMWNELNAGGRTYTNFGYLLPEWRDRGIGRAMLRHNEARSREIAAGQPQDGPRWFESFGYVSETGKHDLLLVEGYQVARSFYRMNRPDLENIPDLRLPDGLEIRPVKKEHLPIIMKAADEAFADAWGEVKHGEDSAERFLGSVECQPEIWKVAWDTRTDEVAGMVLGYIKHEENRVHHRKLGWTENIATRKPWRRQGVAAALMAANMRELKARGMTEAALGVDTENVTGALQLYERMGFRPVTKEYMYRKAMK
jgi:mycothiol synthase